MAKILLICLHELETRIGRGDLREEVKKNMTYETHFEKRVLSILKRKFAMSQALF